MSTQCSIFTKFRTALIQVLTLGHRYVMTTLGKFQLMRQYHTLPDVLPILPKKTWILAEKGNLFGS